jgi:hypothetical protein
MDCHPALSASTSCVSSTTTTRSRASHRLGSPIASVQRDATQTTIVASTTPTSKDGLATLPRIGPTTTSAPEGVATILLLATRGAATLAATHPVGSTLCVGCSWLATSGRTGDRAQRSTTATTIG